MTDAERCGDTPDDERVPGHCPGAECLVTGGQTVLNPKLTIGGSGQHSLHVMVTSSCQRERLDGDVSCSKATKLHGWLSMLQWMEEEGTNGQD